MISVVIPTYNRSASVEVLVQSLFQQRANPLEFEILIVDNFFTETLANKVTEWKSTFTKIVYYFVGTLGVNSARNLGLKKSKGNVVVFLDDDCIVIDPNYINKIWNYHQENPTVVAIGGRYLLPKHASLLQKTYYHISDCWLTASKLTEKQTTNLVGGNVSYKKNLLETHRLEFDEEIIFGGAETSLHSLILRKNLSMYLMEDIPVIHTVQLSYKSLYSRAFQQGRAQERLDWIEGVYKYSTYLQTLPREEQFHALPKSRVYKKIILLHLFLFDEVFTIGRSWARAEIHDESKLKIFFKVLWMYWTYCWRRLLFYAVLSDFVQFCRYYQIRRNRDA